MWLDDDDDPVVSKALRRGLLAAEGPNNRRKWFSDYTYNKFPVRSQLLEGDPDFIIAGWRPREPFITRQTRVLAFGSCFAGNFAEWLANNGYNQEFTASCRALLRNPYENAAVIAQLFRWAFGELDPGDLLWIDEHKQRLIATEERRIAVRQTLLDADVFITTLGLAETWYDKTSGETLWRVIPEDLYDPVRHAHKVLSFAEHIEALEAIDRIRRQWLPELRVVYTVSPIPMSSTFRPIAAVTANSVSKAIIRAALDEFLRTRPAELNSTYFYFPSYELVTTMFRHVFESDGRHLHQYAIEAVCSLFASLYMTEDAGLPIRDRAEWKAALGHDHAEIIALEREIDELTTRAAKLDRVVRSQHLHVKRLKRRLWLPRLEILFRRWKRNLMGRASVSPNHNNE
jgi:hypothetical protein